MSEVKKEQKGLTRRDFVKGAATGVVGGVVVGSVGTALSASEAEPKSWLPKKWDFEADVVVVGFGGAGAAAAITAADAGAKVILIEKMPKGREGGNTCVSGGVMFTITDPVRGPEYIRALIGGTAPADVVEVATKGSHENLEWFPKVLGVGIGTVGAQIFTGMQGNDYPMLPGGSESFGRRHQVQSGDGRGRSLFPVLSGQVAKRGIEVMYETPGKELIQDGGTKEILGVKAESREKEIFIKAKRGVILTTGGFEFNKQMFADYWLPELTIRGSGTPANTGDGHKMAMAVGADLWHMGSMCGGSPYVFGTAPPGYQGAISVSTPGKSFIWVNHYGQRFIDEYRPGHHGAGHSPILTRYDDHLLDYPNLPSYYIFDEKLRQAGGILSSAPVSGWLGLKEGLVWSKDNSVEIAKGWIIKGETIRELAGKLKIDPAKLEETVKRYNGYCAAGEDPEFHRAKGNLVPMVTPPYYSYELCAGILNTQGGPRRNKDAQVLHVNGKPIPRLYCAGELGSIFGFLYNGGCNIGIDCMVFGRVAGQHAASLKVWG